MKGDIKIIQDPKILQQVIEAVGGEGKNNINIIMIGQINSGESGEDEVTKREMAELLRALPEPRLTSLRNLAIQTVMGMFEKTTVMAKFLGINRKTMKYLIENMNTERFPAEDSKGFKEERLIETKKDL
jgi:hypothetical protein